MASRVSMCTSQVITTLIINILQITPIRVIRNVRHTPNNNNRDGAMNAASVANADVNAGVEYDNSDHYSLVANNTICSTDWVLDGGAATHYTNNRELLYNITLLPTPIKTNTANGEVYYDEVGITGVYVECKKVTLTNVAYIPSFKVNLISVSALTDKGVNVMYKNYAAFIMDKVSSKIMFVVQRRGNLYILPSRTSTPYHDTANVTAAVDNVSVHNNNNISADAVVSSVSRVSVVNALRLLHQQYGHMSYSALYKLIKNNSVDGLDAVLANVSMYVEVKLQWVSTYKQLADIFTKALQRTVFVSMRNKLLSKFSIV